MDDIQPKEKFSFFDIALKIKTKIMKTITTLIGFITCTALLGQTVGIFGSTNLSVNNTGTYANPSAVFDISSTDKGLLIPRLTKAQRDGIGTPATSLIIYQTDNTPGYYFYNATTWSLLKVDNGNDCFTNVDVINASGTWTAPAGVTKIMVQTWGAGGGGGGGGGSCGTCGSGGCGGGGGAYAKKFITVVPGNNYSVTVGIGGSGGAGNSVSPASSGTNGGSSSFDAFVTVNGGNGGGGGTNTPAPNGCAGGNGGTTTELFRFDGLPGSKQQGGGNGSGGAPSYCMEGASGCAGGTAGTGGTQSGNPGNTGAFGLAEGGGGGEKAIISGFNGGSGGAGTNGKVLVWY